MYEKKLTLIIFVYMLASGIISANTYSLEFDQVQDKIVVKSAIDGKSLASYVDSETLDRSGSNVYFVKRVNFNQTFNDVKIKLNLDTGVIVKDNLIFPSGYSVETDGQTISIIWNLKEVAAGQNFAISVTLEDTQESFSLFYGALGLFLLLAIVFLIYKSFKKKEKTKNIKIHRKNTAKEEMKTNREYDYLLDTEKQVIGELKKADRNELWQKQIQNSTGFSKAKVSRLIRNLEARGLVTKVPFGNTNKVRLR